MPPHERLCTLEALLAHDIYDDRRFSRDWWDERRWMYIELFKLAGIGGMSRSVYLKASDESISINPQLTISRVTVITLPPAAAFEFRDVS